MTILVIGGTGFISGSLVRRLCDRGDRVTILTRGRSGALCDPRASRITADRSDPRAFASAVGGAAYDVVYDLVAYRPEESAAAARLFRGRLGRFIHCSTVSVYMVSDQVDCPVTEDQAAAPLMPFWDRNPFGMEYGILKRRCEDVLWQAHDENMFPVSMLRPTYVSGPADPAGRDFFWIERLLDGNPLLVPGRGEFRFQQVYVEDVARMFALFADSPGTVGRAYNIAGEETFTLNEYLRALGGLLGVQPELVHIDQETFDGLPFSVSNAGDVFPFNTRREATFSLAAIAKDAAYRSTPFPDWMARTIDWWRTASHPTSNGYDRRKDEIAFIRSIRNSAVENKREGTT